MTFEFTKLTQKLSVPNGVRTDKTETFKYPEPMYYNRNGDEVVL